MKTPTRISSLLAPGIALFIAATGQAATIISIDFVGNATAMSTSETAGVVSATNWNSFSGASGAQSGLVDNGGTATTARVSWLSDTWANTFASSSGDYHMMKGYLDISATITVSNLPSS